MATAIFGARTGPEARDDLEEAATEADKLAFDFFIRPQYTLLVKQWLFPAS
jgi:hypothetical protein